MIGPAARFLLRRVLPSSALSGIPVIFMDPSASREPILDRLSGALAILRERDGRRYRQIRRSVRHVLIWPGHYTAFDRWGGILLSTERVIDSIDAENVAMFVHESTHLRIARHGIRYDRAHRERIERRCVEEEIDSLMTCDLITQEQGDHIRGLLSAPWWTDEAQSRDAEQLVHRAGLPRWTAALLRRVGR